MVVNIVDPPRIDLQYPSGGETLSGIVTVGWQSSDSKNLIIYSTLYYSNQIDGTWQRLGELHDGSLENMSVVHRRYKMARISCR